MKASYLFFAKVAHRHVVLLAICLAAGLTGCSGQTTPTRVGDESSSKESKTKKTASTNEAETLTKARGLISRCQVTKALNVLKPLADQENPLAIYLTGVCYAWPSKMKNVQTANHFYAKAIPGLLEIEKKGNVDAIYYLGRYDFNNGRNAKAQLRLKKALSSFLPKANSNPAIQNRLGDMYYFGLGTKADKRKALGWYKKAAANGDPHSQYMLGYFYLNGDLVAKNKQQAYSYLERACEQGYGPAEAELGWQLFHSQQAKERRRGIVLMKEATAKKTKGADRLMAEINKKTRNIPKNQAEAKSFAKQVARVVGKQIMESVGGGQDLVVKVQAVDYDSILGEFEIDIVVSFNGVIFRSDNYQAAGRITVREDGTNPRFARTAINENFREWASTLDGLKLFNEIVDEINKANSN